MEFQPHIVLRYVLPAVLLGLALVGRELLTGLGDQQLVLAAYLPYVLASVSLLLACQFNRSRIMLLALFTAGSFWVIREYLQVSLSQPDAEHTYLALALAWPLFAIFLLLVPERGIANRWGFLYTLSAGVLVLAAPRLLDLVMALLSEHPDWFKTWPTDAIVLPWFACGLYALAFLFGLFQSWRLGDETEVAIVATLAASFVVLGYFNLAYVSLSLFAAAGLVQAVSLLRSSHAMAYRDELTNLLGRRALNERLKGLGPRYSIAMLDIDHFKKFNDTYGHDTGDEVLKLVASRLARVGAGGTAYRYGGEEFSVVFPRKGIEQCTDALEGLRDAVANYRMTLRDRGARPVKSKEGERRRGTMATRVGLDSVSVTISLGLAERSEDAPLPDDVIKAADRQLYRAKKAGRNKLCY